ncbi:MAG: serine/threonine protein kinase [Anaerolineae bacterium]|nr:serine/threonine protein kinase [Anaerolineae bacterium]
MSDLSGKSIGRYHIKALLGKGGMAEVYRAYDTLLEREIAVKVIRAERSGDESFLKRFEREARAIASLQHPHIVRVHDAGETDGDPYLVMDYLPGGTLKEYIERAGQNRPIPVRQAARLLAPIARALEYAHQHHIVHRDVKPANILLTANGEPMLSDFGIVKLLEDDATQLTVRGMGIGTPEYMSPEQWKGAADARSDIYALGVVFYEMVTGVRPYTANTPAAVMLKHLTTPLPPARQHVPSLPEAVDAILARALAKDPQDRYPDMGGFAADLEKLAQEEKPLIIFTQRQSEQKAATEGGARRFPLWAAGGIGVVLGALTALCVFGALAAVLLSRAAPEGSTLSGHTPPPALFGRQPQPTLDLTQVAQSLNLDTHQPFTEIPGLPPGIPVLLENNGDLTSGETGEGAISYNFSTRLSVEEVIAFYEKGLKDSGWQLAFGNDTSTAEMTSKSFTYQRVQETTCPDGSQVESPEVLMVFVSLIKTSPDTYVSLMYTGKNPCAVDGE